MTESKEDSVLIAIPVLLIGGTEIQTLHLLRALTGAGYSVTACCYYEYDQGMVRRFEESGAKVLLMKYERAQGLWHLAKGLIQLFKSMNPDIVHVQYLAPGLVPVIAARLAGVKTIFATVHQPGTVYGIKEKLLLRLAAGLCTAFICVSQAVEKSWFGDSKVFDPDDMKVQRKHFTIYNAVDVEKIAAIVSATDKQALLKELKLTGHKIIGFVGRLRHEKGLDILIEALPDILKSHPDVVLLVVGDGPDRASLELIAKSLELESNIVWLGQKNPEEVYSLYIIMDVVAVPSRFEGFGLSAAEAMSAGVPVVASAVDGLNEIVEQDMTGYLVAARDAKALSEALIRLLDDPSFAQAAGIRGRQRMTDVLSREQFGRSVCTTYRYYA